MRLSKVIFQNIKSFKEETEIDFSEEINIFIGPNGGGKSNLMNTLSWVLNSRFYSPYSYQIQNNKAVLQVHNFSDNAPEAHWSTLEKPSYIWIEFVATEEDIEGLRDNYRNKDTFRETFIEMIFWEGNEHIDKNEAISDFDKGVIDPDEYGMEPGKKFRYKISIIRDRRVDAILVPVNDEDYLVEGDERKLYDAYLRYLSDSELRKTLKQEQDKISLPYILYAPNREPHDLIVNLSAGHNFQSMSQSYRAEMHNFVFQGRGSSQILAQIASTVIGVRFLELIYAGGLNSAQIAFKNLTIYEELSDELAAFGFKWELRLLDGWANAYQIVIAKAKEEGFFSIAQASSGERQLLNFVFGLTSESIQNSLIIIDEPELNLHPRWQKLLLRFFLRVQKKRKSQFIISTHSASFLDETTLPHVRRIYRKNQSSTLSANHSSVGADYRLLDAIKLLNAQQNERIFFTQKAILVEGQSDYVIWQKLINIALEVFGVGEIIEVIEVLGSSNFAKYRSFLREFEIDNYIIADQDYVALIGNRDIKDIFSKFFQEHKACQSLLREHSLDRLHLISGIETALKNNDAVLLNGILDYLKSRYTKIDINTISSNEMRIFDEFRKSQEEEGVFVLRKGALEAYYLLRGEEAGALKKDTEKAIFFAADDKSFGQWIANGARTIKGESLTKSDKVMAEEAAEFITIALKIIGVELTPSNGEKLLEKAKSMMAQS